MWLSLLFYISILTTSCCGCGSWRYGYFNTYTNHEIVLGSVAEISSCCTFCRNEAPTYLIVFAATYVSSNCYCNHMRYTAIYSAGGIYTMPIYRSPVNRLDTSLTIGESYDVYVTVQEFQNGNDILKIYAITDLNNPVENGAITINSFAEHHRSLTAPQERVLQMSESTKQNGAIVETFESDTKYFVMVHYLLNFMVADNGIEDGGTLWMTSYFANDQYTVVDLKSFTVNHPSSKSCELTNIESEMRNVKRELVLEVKMETNFSCNFDMTNIRIVVHHAENIEMKRWEYDGDSVKATTINKYSGMDEILYERLFVRSKINIKIIYATSEANRVGLKKTAFAIDVFYKDIVENTPVSKVFTKAMNQYLYGVETNTFYVRQPSNGMCMQKNSDDSVEANYKCMLFKQIPHNLLALDGSVTPRCLNVDTAGSIVNCNKEKRFIMDKSLIKSHSGDYVLTDSTSKSAGYSLSTSKVALSREYQNSKSKVIEVRKLGNGRSDVSLLVHENVFSICTPGLKMSANCIKYDPQNGRVTKYSPRIKELLGIDNTSILYGRNEKGRYLTYNAEREIPLLFISARMLEKLESNINVIKSKFFNRSEMVSSNYTFTANGKDYKVTFYGLYDLTLTRHVVLWPIRDCKDIVSKTEDSALHSCKEIKKVCPNAESGVYWIGGDSLTIKKKVYCDMDTDDGGWMLITNYTITDGVAIPITSHFTSDIHDITSSNYTKYLSDAGFSALIAYMKIDQMRFYCTTDVGNTMHLKLLPSSNIGSLFGWFSGSGSIQYQHQHVSLYNDDDSELSRDGENWGEYRYVTCHCNPMQYAVSKGWFLGNYRYSSYRLYQQPIFSTVSQRSWWVGVGDKLLCDEKPNAPTGNLKYGSWKIYVK